MTTPKLVSAVDESGAVLCVYKDAEEGRSWEAITPTRTVRGYAKDVLDVFLPAGYPHTVTPDYTPYQIYDSLQAFSSTIAGLLSSRAVLEGFGVGDSSSSATAAVLLTVLQESTGRLATILFAHRFGQAIEPECKRYRFLADVLNDGALALDVLTPALFLSGPHPHHYARALALCASGVLRALCGVAAGAAKSSLSAHFARGGQNNNLAELNAKDGSQETVISLLGMLAGSLFVRAVRADAAVWLSMALLVAVHLATNYAAVRAVRLRTLNRQRAQLVLAHYRATGAILRPDQAAARERILSWPRPGVAFARTHPRTGEVSAASLRRHRLDRYVLAPSRTGRGGTTKIFLKEGATARDALAAWFEALLPLDAKGRAVEAAGSLEEKPKDRGVLDDEFWKALTSAGWDLGVNALETGPAIRIRVE